MRRSWHGWNHGIRITSFPRRPPNDPSGASRSSPMEIIWRRVALNDLERIRHYIAQENPAAGARIRAMIRTAVEQLADYPNLGRSGRVEGTREFVIAGTPYIVVYRVLNNRLRILSVIHGARRWPERSRASYWRRIVRNGPEGAKGLNVKRGLIRLWMVF